MASILLLPGQSEKTMIILQTRKGSPIPNEQYYEFTASELEEIPNLIKKFPGVTVRTKPNPIYNCHGFTFASRRTWVFDTNYSEILQDDGYAEIPLNEVLPGDIVLYFDTSGSLSHSGMVIEVPSERPSAPRIVSTSEHLSVPRIVSKWGKFGEVIHYVHVVPKEYFVASYRYYRITR